MNNTENNEIIKSGMKKSAVILRILKYLLCYKKLLILAVFLTASSNALALVAPMLSGKAIDAIVGKGNVDFDTVYLYAALMIVFYAASALLTYLLSVLMINISRKVVYTMRRQVFEHLSDLPVGYFDKNQTGDIISRLTYDIDTVNASLSNDLLQIAAGTVTVVGSLIMMISIAPALVLVFAVTITALIIFTRYRVIKVKPLFKARSAELGRLNGYAEEMLFGQKTIKAYGKEEEMIARFDRYNQDAIKAYYKADYQGSIVGPSVNFINNLSLAFISVAGSLLFIAGQLTPGKLSAFILYSRKFSGPVNETANIISEIQSATSAAERIFRLLDEKPEKRDAPDDIRISDARGDVAMQNIHFGYTPGKEVIKNISLHARTGKTVAVVGPTGSGKTTLINLLMRFYDPQAGVITIDNTDTSKATLNSVRSSFTMVLQETWLFGGTIAENIAYGCEEGTLTREMITEAAGIVGIHEYIESLPDGYDTVINENGINISKGQKQLITNARALLLDNPILIFDEATSNVDSRTEKKLQMAMKSIMKNKTCFIVAHRLSTVRDADYIIVMRDGQIIETGSHDELLAIDGGFYRSLYDSQFETA